MNFQKFIEMITGGDFRVIEVGMPSGLSGTLMGILSGEVPMPGCDCDNCRRLRGEEPDVQNLSEEILNDKYPDDMAALEKVNEKWFIVMTTERAGAVKKVLPLVDRLEGLESSLSNIEGIGLILEGDTDGGYERLSKRVKQAIKKLLGIIKLYVKFLMDGDEEWPNRCFECENSVVKKEDVNDFENVVKSLRSAFDEKIGLGEDEFAKWVLSAINNSDAEIRKVCVVNLVLELLWDSLSDGYSEGEEETKKIRGKIEALQKRISENSNGLPVDNRAELIKMAVIRRPFNAVRDLALTIPEAATEEEEEPVEAS